MSKKVKAPSLKKRIADLHSAYQHINPHNVRIPKAVFKPLLTMEQAKLLLGSSQCCAYVDPEFILRDMYPSKTINHPRFGSVDLFDLRMIIDQLLGAAYELNGRKMVQAEVRQ